MSTGFVFPYTEYPLCTGGRWIIEMIGRGENGRGNDRGSVYVLREGEKARGERERENERARCQER
jgi:hypothetical protein